VLPIQVETLSDNFPGRDNIRIYSSGKKNMKIRLLTEKRIKRIGTAANPMRRTEYLDKNVVELDG
jgi:hypothetical protein